MYWCFNKLSHLYEETTDYQREGMVEVRKKKDNVKSPF